jgi:hypothetical protein
LSDNNCAITCIKNIYIYIMILTETYPIQFKPNFKSDTELVSKILDLTQTSYITNTKLIDREISRNKDIYIITNDSDDLLAFFMVNSELVGTDEAYYLGLSGCRDDFKSKGLGKSLYMRFMEDCRIRERKEQKKFLLWWITASPIVYYWFNKHVARVQPDMNGDYTEEGKNIILTVIKEKFPKHQVDTSHPFILRSVAENTTYSANEKARLSAAARTLGMDVFQKFSMREENEDRFLMIGYAPD